MEIEDERGQEGTAGTAVAEPTATTVESECADVEEGEEEEPFYQPTDIAFKSMVFDTQFHPTQNIIAAGLVSGFVKLFKYGDEPDEGEEVSVPTLLHSVKVHNHKACRSIAFTPSVLYTGGTDGAIKKLDVETGAIIETYSNAHNVAINTISISPDGRKLFSGDEDGRIRVWDINSSSSKTKKCVFSFKKHHDYISAFLSHPQKPNVLVAASGDGCLSGWNLAKGDVDGISENLNDEILSLALMPDGERLLCGTQDGVVNLFEWGAWGEPVGSYRGHPASISSIVVVDNNSVFTGSSDGLIRVVQVAPHKIYGVFGDCGDLPVEELRLSHDNSLLASVSHDLAVRFWDVREYFVDEMEADDDDDDDIDEKDDDSDSDDNDDMEEEEEKEEDEDEDEDIVALDKKKRKLSDDADDDDLSDGSDSDDDKSTKKVNAKQQQKQKQKKQPQQKAQQKKKNSGGNNNNKKKKNKKKKKKKGFFGGL